ncbi:MAG: hypothetical protein KA052_02180 [Candidatus Pacebacteria bacterium]|nr:hypothetical protein [Candidatus Paceibacterota bacterium]
MSFWNNPENSSIKVLLAVVVLAGIGAFAFYARNESRETTGRVIGCRDGDKVWTADHNCVEMTDKCTKTKPAKGCPEQKDPLFGDSVRIDPATNMNGNMENVVNQPVAE